MAGTMLTALTDDCAASGFDLSAVTAVGLYNATVEDPYRLPGDDGAAVVVIGNTTVLWPFVTDYVKSQPVQPADPIDRYTEQTIRAAVAVHVPPPAVIDIRFAHEPPPRRIAIQRLAAIAGMAWLSPSHLCVHPVFGPWMALRAAIVLDHEPATIGAPIEAPCRCEDNCLPRFEEAIAAGEPKTADDLREHWRLWLATRDACPVGRRHRYPEEQIEYHYTGRRPAGWPPVQSN